MSVVDKSRFGPLVVDAALLQRFDRPGPRYTSYPTANRFHSGYGECDYRAALSKAASGTGSLSLYTHLPFCEARCLYCACNVVIDPKHAVADPYLERVKREVDLVSECLGSRRTVGQFHLGGGTPTYYSPAQLVDLMDQFRRHFAFEGDAELAVEVDPRVTSEEHLEALAGVGFNRMSLGVQDFDTTVQQAVNRVQSVEQTRSLMEHGRRLGFASQNIDLIYGLPFQTPESFAATIDQVIELAPDRLAVYSFAHVPWLKHHQKLLPEQELPAGLAKFELLVVARERLLGAGYLEIGMDHFAKPDDGLSLAQANGTLWRNFMGYTTVRSTDLIGFGSSAIGTVAGTYAQNAKKLSHYYRLIDEGRLAVERGYAPSFDDLVRRDVIQSWMCQLSIDKSRIEARYGISFDGYFAREMAHLREPEADGFVRLTPGSVDAGELGKLFPRNLAMIFDAHLGEAAAQGPVFSRTV